VFYLDIIYEIRGRHLVQKQTITEIARDMGLSRQTVHNGRGEFIRPNNRLRANEFAPTRVVQHITTISPNHGFHVNKHRKRRENLLMGGFFIDYDL